MNDIRKEAMKETVKILLGITLISLLVPALLFTVPLQVLGIVGVVAMLVFAVKMVYDIQLSRAEYRATLNRMVDKS